MDAENTGNAGNTNEGRERPEQPGAGYYPVHHEPEHEPGNRPAGPGQPAAYERGHQPGRRTGYEREDESARRPAHEREDEYSRRITYEREDERRRRPAHEREDERPGPAPRRDDDGHHVRHRHDEDGVTLDIHLRVNCCPPAETGRTGQPGGYPGGEGEGQPGGKGGAGGTGSSGGTDGGRPVHKTGTSDGSLGGSKPTIGGVIGSLGNTPGNVWPGPRKDMPLPYLFMRANAGDRGTRPVIGHFWESPDIFILPGVAPQNAPGIPAVLGGTARANVDNTVYAHVWNFGLGKANDVLVEFYWFNPTLGFSSESANLIGFKYTDLAARGSTGSHKVVKCPNSWPATYVNGGHECLVVRISQQATDPLSGPAWDASQNRHVAQRNIHVMSAAEAQARPTIGLAVGPLFGAPAQVQVERHDPATMPWLHLVTMDRGRTFANAAGTGAAGITRPMNAGGGVPDLGAVADPQAAGLIAGQHTVNGDDQQVGFHANDAPPAPGQAHVYRVSASQNGQIVGGYTVVVLG